VEDVFLSMTKTSGYAEDDNRDHVSYMNEKKVAMAETLWKRWHAKAAYECFEKSMYCGREINVKIFNFDLKKIPHSLTNFVRFDENELNGCLAKYGLRLIATESSMFIITLKFGSLTSQTEEEPRCIMQ